jgi:hypothetical protein
MSVGLFMIVVLNTWLQVYTGLQPFHECSNDLQIMRKLDKSEKPAQLDDVTIMDQIGADMRELMDRCWITEPARRPTCQQIQTLMEVVMRCGRKSEETDGRSAFGQYLHDGMGLDTSAVDPKLVLQLLDKVSDHFFKFSYLLKYSLKDLTVRSQEYDIQLAPTLGDYTATKRFISSSPGSNVYFATI